MSGGRAGLNQEWETYEREREWAENVGARRSLKNRVKERGERRRKKPPRQPTNRNRAETPAASFLSLTQEAQKGRRMPEKGGVGDG